MGKKLIRTRIGGSHWFDIRKLGTSHDLVNTHNTPHRVFFSKQKKVVSTCVKQQTEDTPTTNMALNPIKVVWLKLWHPKSTGLSPFPYENICHSWGIPMFRRTTNSVRSHFRSHSFNPIKHAIKSHQISLDPMNNIVQLNLIKSH